MLWAYHYKCREKHLKAIQILNAIGTATEPPVIVAKR